MDESDLLSSPPPQVEHQDAEEPAGMSDLHPLAQRTLRGFAKAKPDEDGRLRPTISRTLDIHVSAGNVERAVRVMDGVLKALQSAGWKFGAPQEGHGLTVNVEGEQLGVRLYEGIGRVNHVPTEEERVRIKKYPDIHGVPEWGERPSGKLNLAIGKEEFSGVRMRWTDGKGHPLETKVESFIQGLTEAARAKLGWRKECEEQQRRWEEDRRKEQEASDRRYEEQQRAERLQQQVEDWEKSRRIREYIADMRANAVRPETWKIGEIPLPEWMTWALGFADSIDPVAPIRKARLAASTDDHAAPDDSGPEVR